MPFASLALAVAVLAAPQAMPRTPADRPHQLGVGAALVASNVGGGGSFRYWFGEHVGVDLNAFVSRPRVTLDERATIVQVAPSFVVLLGHDHPDREVNVRPFIGGGVIWARASFPEHSTLASRTGRGTGGQFFGGVEMTFAETPGLALSASAVYSHLPIRYNSAYAVDGFNVVVAVHYYVR